MSSTPPQMPPSTPASGVPLASVVILAVAAMAITGLVALTFLVLYAPIERDVIVVGTLLIGSIATISGTLLAYGKAQEAKDGVQQLDIKVDGRLTKLLEETQLRSAAEATLIERAAGTATALEVAAATVTAAVNAPDPTTVAAAAVEAARAASRGITRPGTTPEGG